MEDDGLLAAADCKLRRRLFVEAWSDSERLLLAARRDCWRAQNLAGRVHLEWGKASEDELRDSRLERAIGFFDAALALLPDDSDDVIEIINDRGVSRYELGHLDEAKADFQAVLLRRPHHESALCNMGLILWAGGHTRGALSRFDQAIAAAKGTNPCSLNNRGALRLEVIGGEEGAHVALPDFHAALALDGGYETARRNRDHALETLAQPVPLPPVAEPV